MYYTTYQVAEMFDVNPETIRRWVRTGKLKSVELNSKREGFRIAGNSIEEFKKQYGKCQISDDLDSTDLDKVVARLNLIKIHMAKIDELVGEVDEILERL